MRHYNVITKPRHYNQYKYEPLDVIEDWDLPHHLACVVKYIARYRHKNGLQDLEKANYYLNRYVKNNRQHKKTTLSSDNKGGGLA